MNTGRVIWIVAAALAAGGTARAQPDNLLANPGFEDGTREPEGWVIGDAPRGVAIRRDNRIKHEGRGSLKLTKSAENYFPPAAVTQTLDRDPSWSAIELGAEVRTVRATKVTLDVRFEGGGQKSHEWAAYIGAEDEGDPPVTHDWRRYSGTVQVPEWAETITIAVEIWGPGTAWVDNVSATPVVGADGPADDEPASQPSDAGDDAAPATPGEDLLIDNDTQRRYFLHVPEGEAPAKGRGLLVVLPGGDGSAEFAPFVAGIAANGVPDGYIVAQAVAPVWTDSPERIVWPTQTLPDENMRFPTEQFVEDIVGDVGARHAVDPGRVYLLAWSSGGPAAYATALRPGSPARGALVAMSVFKPDILPALGGGANKAFYILHSPQDFIPMRFPEDARDQLARNGAKTTLETYEGGHGWHGDAFAMIRAGIDWLEERTRR